MIIFSIRLIGFTKFSWLFRKKTCFGFQNLSFTKRGSLSYFFFLLLATTLQSSPAPRKTNALYYSIPPIVCTLGLVFFLFVLWRRHKRAMDKVNEPLVNASPPTPISTRPVNWHHVVSRGQFGCVWRASYEGNDAAIKIIQAQEKSSWITEKTMYQNYNLVHENILKFYSAEKRLSDTGMIQYWIVTQYHDNGSLSDYLRENILDWNTTLKLMISMVKGLAFLHVEDLTKNPVKPVISHRDFKSRNILVKSDLTCCISDFGSACQFSDLTENEETKAQVRFQISFDLTIWGIQTLLDENCKKYFTNS